MKNLFHLSRFLCVGVPVVLAAPVWAQTVLDPGSVQTTNATDECGRSSITYTDEEGLTLEEIIRRMDRAFTRSLNRYDECENSEDENAASEREDSPDQGAETDSGGSTEAENAASEGEAAEGESAAAAPGDISGNEAGSEPGQDPFVTSLPTLADGQAGSTQADGIEGDNTSASAGAPSVAAGDIAGDEPDLEPIGQARASGTIGGEQSSEQAGQAGGSGDGRVAGTGTQVLNNGKLPEDIPASDNDSVLEAQIRQAAIDEPDPELQKKLWNEYRRYKGLPQIN